MYSICFVSYFIQYLGRFGHLCKLRCSDDFVLFYVDLCPSEAWSLQRLPDFFLLFLEVTLMNVVPPDQGQMALFALY